jgi:hypothetical protein
MYPSLGGHLDGPCLCLLETVSPDGEMNIE